MTVRKILLKLLIRLANEILPMIFWILVLFGFDKPYVAVLTILAAVLHEIGHFIPIYFLKCDTGTPIGHFSGFRIKEKRLTSYKEEILILASGPLANLLTFLLLLPFISRLVYLRMFAYVNLATAISNLLPIKNYDGYSIGVELSRMYSKEGVTNFLDSLSFLISGTFAFTALYLMYYHDTGYWIFGLFTASMLSEISQRLKKSVF